MVSIIPQTFYHFSFAVVPGQVLISYQVKKLVRSPEGSARQVQDKDHRGDSNCEQHDA
jgi:hypothetical protein